MQILVGQRYGEYLTLTQFQSKNKYWIFALHPDFGVSRRFGIMGILAHCGCILHKTLLEMVCIDKTKHYLCRRYRWYQEYHDRAMSSQAIGTPRFPLSSDRKAS